MKIGFVAHEVHRRGGMERAASEVLERVAQKHDIVVIAKICEVMAARLKWLPIRSIARPNVLQSWIFRRKAREAESSARANLTFSIGAAAIDADVISAQFCHAAFTQRYGGLRGGKGKLRQGYQLIAQHMFARQERRAYTSRRLKK